MTSDDAIFGNCPCCGSAEFQLQQVLWPELISAWGLHAEEVDYIDRQQGFSCSNCSSSLRSMALASAIMRCYRFDGLLREFFAAAPDLRVLEINEAGNLTQFLRLSDHHCLRSFPDIDVESLPFEQERFDLVVHSDTLEHVRDPVRGLQEIHRVLAPGGFTCFTVPIVVGRLTARRDGLPPSYHGSERGDEYLVHTEYGADVWSQVIEAGFDECRIVSLEYPGGLALVGVKAAA